MPQILDLATQLITGRANFKANMQSVVTGGQLLDQPLGGRWAILNLAEKPDPSPPAAFGDRYGMLPLRNIETHKGFALVSHGPLPRVSLGSVGRATFVTTARGRAPPASRWEHDVWRACRRPAKDFGNLTGSAMMIIPLASIRL